MGRSLGSDIYGAKVSGGHVGGSGKQAKQAHKTRGRHIKHTKKHRIARKHARKLKKQGVSATFEQALKAAGLG